MKHHIKKVDKQIHEIIIDSDELKTIIVNAIKQECYAIPPVGGVDVIFSKGFIGNTIVTVSWTIR